MDDILNNSNYIICSNKVKLGKLLYLFTYIYRHEHKLFKYLPVLSTYKVFTYLLVIFYSFWQAELFIATWHECMFWCRYIDVLPK